MDREAAMKIEATGSKTERADYRGRCHAMSVVVEATNSLARVLRLCPRAAGMRRVGVAQELDDIALLET